MTLSHCHWPNIGTLFPAKLGGAFFLGGCDRFLGDRFLGDRFSADLLRIEGDENLMQILIVYPRVQGIRNGNEVTAERWSDVLQSLGHWTAVVHQVTDSPFKADLMIALHAVKSGDAVLHCRSLWPACKIIVAVTGTDIYGGQCLSVLRDSLRLADRIVVLQEATKEDLPDAVRPKARVIFQSLSLGNRPSRTSTPPAAATVPRSIEDNDGRDQKISSDVRRRRAIEHSQPGALDRFDICVVGHLREVKDPFVAAEACRNLPAQSRVQVTQIGAAMSPAMQQMAAGHAADNDRYRWVGGVSREEAMATIASSDLLVNSSKVEGGAAVITEAIMVGTPVLATRIAGNWGLLGGDYGGLFEVGDWRQLLRLILRSENEPAFYRRLQDQCDARRHLFHPDFERLAWKNLVSELS